MVIPAPLDHKPAELRVQCRKPARGRDPWEDEAESLAEWLARPRTGGLPEIHPVPIDSNQWGTPIDARFAARARRHPGHPLDPATRRHFEARFHHDFSDVRIHDDRTARDLTRSLGAEAFTLGRDIFTTRSDRALLAHEIVHTVQQESVPSAQLSQIQASFEKTTAELDPKVEILLNLYLRSRGKQLKGIADTQLLATDSWWRKLRAKLEDKKPATPVDAKAEVEAAVKEIRKLAPLDTEKGDPIQNGVAGLLADYLRINDASELAAFVVIEFPYSRTALPTWAVYDALALDEKRGSASVVALPRIWSTGKPKGATAETWTQEIADALNQFLKLTPLKEHLAERKKIVEKLQTPLRGKSNIPDSATAPPTFERLTDTSTLTANELDELARTALFILRKLWGNRLQHRIDEAEQQTSMTPYNLWYRDVELLKSFIDGTNTAKDPLLMLKGKDADTMRPIFVKAQTPLKNELDPIAQAHHTFWEGLIQSVNNDSPGEADKYLKLTYGEKTYAQLFFAADEGALAVHLQEIVRPLANAVQVYFDLFDTPKPPAWKERVTVLQIYARHKQRADAFRETLRVNIQPAIVRKIYAARIAGKSDLSRALGWFGQWMEEIYVALEKVQEIDANTSATALIDTVQTRLRIATNLWKIAAEALGKTEAEESGSTKPGEKSAPAAPKRNVPAASAWQAIMDRTGAALTLDDIQAGMLILNTPFKESQRSEIDQLSKDNSSNSTVRGLEPFTGSELVTFYALYYRQTVTAQLTALSDEATDQEAAFNPRVKGDLWLVQRATDEIKSRSGPDALPQRYASRSVYWYPYEKDDRLAFGRLLEQQKLYQDFFKERGTEDNIILHADSGPDDREDAWAWTLPLPNNLVEPLYKIDLLRGIGKMTENDLTAALAKGVKPEEKNASTINAHAFTDLITAAQELGRTVRANSPPPEGYFYWYQAVNTRIKTIREILQGDVFALQAIQKVGREKGTDLTKELSTARREYLLALRRATTLDRQVIRRLNHKLLQEAIDERISGMPGIAVALDNHDVFRNAVRPYEPKSEMKRQSAALLLEDADTWLDLMANARVWASDKTRSYTLISESIQTFPELLKEPGKDTPEITDHSKGIAWESAGERRDVAKKIAEVTPKFQNVLDSLKAGLQPLRWELGITGKAAEGKLISHLSPGFPLFTVDKIQEANATEKDQSKHKSELIPFRGTLSMKIVKIHQDFTYMPGIGDRLTASASWMGGHALYIPGQVFVGVSASDQSDLDSLKATHEEDPKLLSFETPKESFGAPLVDIEIWENNALFSKFSVHAGDINGSRSGLNWMAGVVHSITSSEKLASMAADIELFAHAILFAASIFPPTALAVTAAEVTAFLATILGDKEFREAIESIASDPIESVKHAASELKAQFTIERLFDLLMNGNFEPDRFLGAATLRGKKRSNKLTRGTMARVLTRLKRIGAVLALRLEGFQEAVQGPVHRIEYLMAKHPRLATMLEWLAVNLRYLKDPELVLFKHPIAGPIYEAYLLYRQLGRDEGGQEGSMATIGQPLSQASSHLQSGLDRMANFQLPATILPLDLAIEALVDIALKLMPKTGKIGIARALGQMAQGGLKSTGTNTVVYGFLADKIENTWADPNVYWRSEVVPQLGPPVRSAIQSAADTIGEKLAAAPLIGDYFGNDRVKNAKIPVPPEHRAKLPTSQAAGTANVTISEEADEDFDSAHVADLVPDESGMSEGRGLSYSDIRELPDAFFEGIPKKPAATTPQSSTGQETPPPAGSPSLTPAGASAPGALSPTGHSSSAFASAGGAPLSPGHRADAERQFGHDLSHVRLHQGPDSWAATAQRGADGLTVSNHVYLRPDLSPRSGRGQTVMNHELAHVLQKTSGPGPASRPTSGGLRWRPHEESAANRMADLARHNTSGNPIPIEGAHRDGASPSISLDLMKTFFEKLSSPSAGASFAETIEHAHKRHKAARVHPDTLTRAEAIWTSIRGTLGKLTVASHFQASADKIKKHLDNRLSTLTHEGESVPAASRVIAYIAALSEKEPPPPTEEEKKKAGGGKPAKGKPTFDTPSFLADLSLYITGRSGIVFDFDLSPAEIESLKTNPSARVSVTTKVSHVELLFVSSLSEAGLALWDTAITNSRWKRSDDKKERRDALRRVLEKEFGAAAPASTTADTVATPTAGQPVTTKPPGRGLGSYTPLWDTTAKDLALTASYVEKVETQIAPAALSSDLMPPWGYFADPANEKFSTISASATQVKQNAVHYIGKTHGELTDGSFFLEQNRRNSHHIVQYLLPEYFANIKEAQPFPKLKKGSKYPGVTAPSGSRVETISGDGLTIGVGETEKGSRRAHAMPAVLLSEEAHLNSGLHVTPKPDDTGKATQGFAIHQEFRKHLTACVLAELGVKLEGDALDDRLLTLVGNPKAEKAIVDAVRQTYAWIKGQNEVKLLDASGMSAFEANFYINQFAGTPEGKKNFQAINKKDFDTDSADVRTRIQTRIHSKTNAMLTEAIKKLAEPPFGWKLP